MPRTIDVAATPHSTRTLSVWAVFIAPLLVFLAAAYFAPLLGIVSKSVTTPTLGLSNYVRIVTDAGIHSIFWRTFRVCTTTAIISTVIAYFLAYHWVFGPPRLRRVIELAILIPFWISVLIRAFGWLVLLRPNGLINQGLLSAGLVGSPIAMVRNEIGVVIGMTQFMVPFAVFPLAAVMRQIDVRILQAAQGLGSGAVRRFVEIFLPLTVSGIIGAYFIVFVFALGFYITPAILGGGRVVMVAEYVFTQMSQMGNWGLGSALATVLLVIVGGLTWVVSRFVDFNKLRG